MTIDDIHKNIVRVNEGSGIILKNDNKHYVFTAYHNVKYSIHYDESVDIKNDRNIKININKSYYQEDKDIALFEVDYINDISVFKADNDIKSNDKITFIGYPDKGNSKRKRLSGVIDEWTDKTSIKVSDNINPSFVEDERANKVIVGFSGSAVFKTNDDEISFIGLLKSLPEKDLYYNEINCIPISDILNFLEENNLSIIKYLMKRKKTMLPEEKISNNPVFSFGNNNTSNNSQINTGNGTINVSYEGSKKEVSINDAKKLFNSKKYIQAKEIFSNLMPDNDECKILFILCSLSRVKISNINKYVIEDLYDLLDEITDENFKRISNHLWLVIFYEYTNAHSIPQKLDNQHKERRSFAIRNTLKSEEKNILNDIKMVSEKSTFL